MIRFLIVQIAVHVVMFGSAVAGQQETGLRFGYLDDPGSALILLADVKGHFKSEQVTVTLIRYTSTQEILTALGSDAIQAGSVPLEEALRAVSTGKRLKIISGGGTPKGGDDLLKELVPSYQSDYRTREIVTVAQEGLGKKAAVQLVAALIRSHVSLQHEERKEWPSIREKLTQTPVAGSIIFDPNPDFYRFEALWKELRLQRPEMRRDHLAGAVYEEIYCDALDRVLVEGDLNDPTLQQLFKKAICVPDCCPANTGKLFNLQGGVTQ
jgi:hypothetical protein